MPHKTPGGMCNLHVLAKYLEHEAAHNRIKYQLVGGSQLALQAWRRILTQDDWEQIQKVARVGFEPRNTGLQVQCTGHSTTYAASYFKSSPLKTYHVIDGICTCVCRGGIVETTGHHGSKRLITHQLTKPLCCKPTNTISFQNTADNFLQKLLIVTVKIFPLVNLLQFLMKGSCKFWEFFQTNFIQKLPYSYSVDTM